MVSENFPVAASDEYAERNSSHNALHRLSPSPAWQVKGSYRPHLRGIVRQTVYDLAIY